MRSKLWFLQIPFILFFTACYVLTEFGSQGKIEHQFLRESIYLPLSRPINFLTDLKFKFRGPVVPKNKIVIVQVDSPALDTFGRWPWHRDLMSYLIEKTFEAGAKVVGLDIVFSEADPRVPPELKDLLKTKSLESMADQFETDKQLEETIRRHRDHLVLAWTTELLCQPGFEEAQYCPVTDPQSKAQFPEEFQKFSIGEFRTESRFDPAKTPIVSFLNPIANLPAYTAAGQSLGFLNAFLDPDGYIRRSSLLIFANAKPYPSLAFEMARVGLGEKVALDLDDKHRVKNLEFLNQKRKIDTSPLASASINFRGPGSVFTHVSALDVMNDQDTLEDHLNQKLTGQSKREILKDAYVIIGVSAIGVFDMRQFPFETNAPGVDGHANLLDNLLSNDLMVQNRGFFGFDLMLFLMLVGTGVLVYAISRLEAVPAMVLFGLVLFGLGYLDFGVLFSKNQNWNTVFLYFEVIWVIIVTFLAKYVQEEQKKKFIRGAFSKYVAPLVVDSILKDPTKLSLGGEKKELTILFSDIRGFTTFSEKMDAKALTAFLNDFLGTMTKIVFANRGTLDKYMGDAIMAFWGAPLSDAEHALHACQAACQMAQALAQNRERYKTQYGIEVNIGIGINSGVVNVGNMGSDQNFEYTVIGDHVNLASRVEGITKEYGVEIMTTRNTLDLIRASSAELPSHRVLDDVKVKGKKTSVELIELKPEGFSQEAVELFEQAKALYRQRKWDEALERFQKASQAFAQDASPGARPDGPCATYMERCAEFKKNPPEANWDGSWKMESK
ncbi:MAG: CHASE2 domain-containing protein [Bdellovibrionia bacterium]